MGKEIKTISLDINETLYISKLCKTFGFLKENINNGKGGFAAIKISSLKPIIKEDIETLKRGFKKQFKANLHIKRVNQNNLFHCAYITKIS